MLKIRVLVHKSLGALRSLNYLITLKNHFLRPVRLEVLDISVQICDNLAGRFVVVPFGFQYVQ